MSRAPWLIRISLKAASYPSCILLIGPLIAGVAYTVPLGLVMLLSGGDVESTASWQALLLGFLGLLVVPGYLQQTLGTGPYLLLIFFSHVAILGFIASFFIYLWVASKMPVKGWPCPLCNEKNLSGRFFCVFCDCPVYAKEKQLEAYRKYYQRHSPTVHETRKKPSAHDF